MKHRRDSLNIKTEIINSMNQLKVKPYSLILFALVALFLVLSIITLYLFIDYYDNVTLRTGATSQARFAGSRPIIKMFNN
jgi:hypothetical protein